MEKKRYKLTAKDLRRIKGEATRKSLSSSATIFLNCNLPAVSRSTRCHVLRDMSEVKKAPARWRRGTGIVLAGTGMSCYH